jgi:hypothetical protein
MYMRRYRIFYDKVYFSCKIQLFVTAKYDQDPDPHLFGSVDPDSGPH